MKMTLKNTLLLATPPLPQKKQLIFFSTYKADKYAPSVTELTRGGDVWWVGCTS